MCPDTCDNWDSNGVSSSICRRRTAAKSLDSIWEKKNDGERLKKTYENLSSLVGGKEF